MLEDVAEALAIAQLGVWRWVVGTQQFAWSAEFYRIAGRDPATFTPTLDATLAHVHADDVDAVAAQLTAATAGQDTGGHNFRIVRTDGAVRHCWAKLRATREAGSVVAVRGAVLDLTERHETEQRLAESEENHRQTIELNPQIPWTADPQGNILGVSSRWLAKVGLTDAETHGRGWTAALHPDDAPAAFAAWEEALASGRPLDVRYRLRLKEGSYRWFRARAGARRDEHGAILRWYGVVEDIDDQVSAEQALQQAEERYRLAARATNDLIWDHDLVTDRIRWNESEDRRFGYANRQLGATGAWWAARIHPADRDRVVTAVRAVIDSRASQFVEEYRFRRADGDYADVYDRGYILRDDEGQPVRLVGAMQDVTDRKRADAALRDSQSQLRWGATHDALTGVANRTLFQETLGAAIDRAAKAGHHVGLIELDVDEFKSVNDKLGHAAGDAVLRTLVSRIREGLRPDDVLARLGGDEFAIVLPDLRHPADVDEVVGRILTRMRAPFLFEGHTLDSRATIGSSLFPRDGLTPEELMKSADIALAIAKAAGRGQHRRFVPDMRVTLQHRTAMLNVAREALADNCIVPFYQPKVALRDGRIDGFEALLRWRDPAGNVHGPETLVAAFDDLELAAAMSDRMIELAIGDMRRWLDAGIEFGHVAINAAAAEFRRDDFGERLLEQLRRAGVPTRYVQLEVTETVFLGRGSDYVDRALKLLCLEGVRIALDDFGTGYASLRHLKQFPVHVIKIDRSFVDGMRTDDDDATIIRALLSLGRGLGIEVVAEGIEEAAQAEALRDLGCDYGQGFLYAKAVPAAEVPALLARGIPSARGD
jgi:diguanylate cyclase (GGDEF)-like protein/PAS domain S-box-containing protein